MSLTVRTIQRLEDGAIKRAFSGSAAKLVSKGKYKYIDDGEDESLAVIKQDTRKLTTMEKKPSDILITQNISIVESELAPEQVRKLRGKRVIKKDTIPEARMSQIIASATPVPASISPGRGSTALKGLIEKTKAKRKEFNK